MVNVVVTPWANLPAHMKGQERVSANYLLIYDDDNLVDYYTDEKMSEKFTDELQPLIEWISKAYKLGAGNTDKKPSPELCAYIAHLNAEEIRTSKLGAGDPYELRKATDEARKFDEVSDRFAKGLTISEIRDMKGRLVAFKIKGESGFTYSLDRAGTSCTCRAAMTGSNTCWHMRAVEIYLEAYKSI